MGRSEDYGRRESPTWVSEAGLPAALRALRERDGRTQKEVADDAGVSPATIARLESGDRRPSRKVLFQLAHAYRVTPEQLLEAAERIDAGEEPAKVLATLGTGSGADAARAAPAPAAATAADTAGDYAPPVWQQDDLERQRLERRVLAALDRLPSDGARQQLAELLDDLTSALRTRTDPTDLAALHRDIIHLLRGHDATEPTIAALRPGQVRYVQLPGFARDERGAFWVDPSARARMAGTDSLDPRIERYDDGRVVLDISRLDARVKVPRRDPARHLFRALVQGGEVVQLPTSLDMQYAQAELVLHLDDGRKVVIVPRWDGGTPGTLPDGLPGGTDHLHVLTACNPRGRLLQASENAERTRLLERQLEADGLSYLPAVARSPDGSWTEPGFAVLDAELSDVVALADGYEQSAIYELTADRRRILWTDPDVAPIQHGWEVAGTSDTELEGR